MLPSYKIIAYKVIFAAFLLMSAVHAQPEIIYEASFENALHHEAEIKISYLNLQTDTLKLIMSQASPGRYAHHDFAKNIYNLKASDGFGTVLNIFHPYPNQWHISGYEKNVEVTYTLFAAHGSGTYSSINSSHAHLNIPSAFLWAKGFEKIPLKIKLNPPDKWEAATQLYPTIDWNIYTAPDLQYFLDSPIELSEFAERSWKVESNDEDYLIKLAVHHLENDEITDAFAEIIKAVTAEQKNLFGEFPDFDNKEYIFIADYLPDAMGDGMEHRNSSVVTSTMQISSAAVKLISTISHEFFHAWNGERIRPQSIEPFDFEKPAVCNELWFLEGVTEYYEDLILCRAGILNLDSFAEELSNLLNEVSNSPGREYYGPAGMSGLAPFFDGVHHSDFSNQTNTYISYYSYGAVTALALDLTLRKEYPSVTLDNLMKRMWGKFGRKEKPYNNEEIKITLGEVTNDPEFAAEFFNKYVYGNELPDFEELLASAGLSVRKKNPGQAYLGNIKIRIQNNKCIQNEAVVKNTPIYNSGISLGDAIVRIDNVNITNQKSIDSVIAGHKPGQTVLVRFEKSGVSQFKEITFAEDPAIEIVSFEKADKLMNEKIRIFRKNWLTSSDPDKLPILYKYCGTCGRRYPFTYQYCSTDGGELMLIPKKEEGSR